jgi:transposase
MHIKEEMKIDGRGLDRKVCEYLRRRAVERYLDGEKPSVIMETMRLCRTTIYKWIKDYKEQGWEALKSTQATGREPKLTDKQREKVKQWIVGKDPRQYGFDFGLWTRQIVGTLIEKKFGVRFCLNSVGRLLASLNITPQKPLRRAYERDPQAIEQWVKESYRAIRDQARKQGAIIFFLDEAGVRSDDPLSRSWGLRGQRPQVLTAGKRQSINAISAVNARGAFWYQTYSGSLNGSKFVELLKQFMQTRRKVVLILDQHPVHKSNEVLQYVQSLKGRLSLHFLPGYAPELNPDEFVWSYLKSQGPRKIPLQKGESLKERVINILEKVKRSIHTVRSFFGEPKVAYARY